MTIRRPAAQLVPIALAVLLVPAHPGRAQGTKADYERAASFANRTRDKVVGGRVEPHWSKGGATFWYRAERPGGAREFLVVDAERGTRRPAFDAAKLAEALAKATGKEIKADALPFDRIALADDGAIRFEAEGQGWRYDPEHDTLAKDEPPGPEPETPSPRPGRPTRRRAQSSRSEESPDGRWVTFVKDYNLHIREKDGGAERPLSFTGHETDAFEARVFWSPDSTRLVALRTAKGDDHQVTLVESSPRDRLQPKVHSFAYLKPGDRIPITKPHLFDVAKGLEIEIADDLFPNPWSVEDFRWSPDSSRFTFVYNQRGHQVLRIIAVDAKTGRACPIVDESSKTFIDYAHKQFAHYLDATDEIIWMSERDGWNHLYLIDAATGSVKNPITRGDWLVRSVDRVDEEKRQVWFQAGGIRPGQDPYFVHFARVNFDGSGLTILTEGDGTHEVRYSPDGRYLIDTYSRVDMPPVVELRKAEDGSLVCALEKADWSALLETGWKVPERFAAKGRDGSTEIYGVIYRPSNFDPEQKYPVIEAIYAGPQGAFVPKRFATTHRAQALAELGFILVQIDGMGTNWRRKSFHDVCWKNLGDAGFPDRIAWLKAASEKYPALDLSRVGIYGGSAGGQNALGGLLFHPEFYKVGAADCGCHDNRMDKIWWNELWMGWPIGPHYAEQSNATNAHKLQGKLLLTVGEQDRNVDPASTMQVVDALIKADKDFELIVFPGAGHGAGGGRYGRRRMEDFFVRHLLGVEPRRESGESPAASRSGETSRPEPAGPPAHARGPEPCPQPGHELGS